MSLFDHLAAAYNHAIGRSVGSPQPAFAAALAADPALKQEAQAKLAEYPESVCRRCFCSRTYRDAITNALKACG